MKILKMVSLQNEWNECDLVEKLIKRCVAAMANKLFGPSNSLKITRHQLVHFINTAVC